MADLFGVREFGLLNVGPGCDATLMFRCDQPLHAFVFKGVRPLDVDCLRLVVDGRVLFDVSGAVDDEGERLSAGEALCLMNGRSGCGTVAGAFSMWLKDDRSPAVELVGRYIELRVGLSRELKSVGLVRVLGLVPFKLWRG